MTIPRRNIPMLVAAAMARTKAQGAQPVSPSQTWRFEDLPIKASGDNKGRQVIDAHTHTGYHFDLHETELGVGMAPHPPHRHEHEEMIMLFEGTVEVTISGKSSRLGPGSVAYVASNEEHGWKNVGETRASYFVIAFGRPG